MDEVSNQSVGQNVRRSRTREGSKNHIIIFVISIALTFVAFMAAANHLLSPGFVLFLLVIMAILQAVLQLSYWMHLKDKGHAYPIIFISLGAFVALLAFLFAIYWTWW